MVPEIELSERVQNSTTCSFWSRLSDLWTQTTCIARIVAYLIQNKIHNCNQRHYCLSFSDLLWQERCEHGLGNGFSSALISCGPGAVLCRVALLYESRPGILGITTCTSWHLIYEGGSTLLLSPRLRMGNK